MKLIDLIEKLKEFPGDMEIVTDDGGMDYNRTIDLQVITATVHPGYLNNPTEYTLYYKEASDDYWNFQRVNTDVLLIY
jgi:hypothetical protein